jgi:hypothetical protein
MSAPPPPASSGNENLDDQRCDLTCGVSGASSSGIGVNGVAVGKVILGDSTSCNEERLESPYFLWKL